MILNMGLSFNLFGFLGRLALSNFIKACRLGMWPAEHSAKVKALIKQWQ